MKIRLGLWGAAAVALPEIFGDDFEAHALDNVDQALKTLHSGDLQAVVLPLHRLSTTLPEGLAITAVTARGAVASRLAVSVNAQQSGAILGLAPGIRVSAPDAVSTAQLLAIRPDLDIRQQDAEAEAWIIPADQLQQAGQAGIVQLELHPKEFIPAPGQGVMAWVCWADDLSVRRQLRPWHHPEVSACTNVERGLLQIIGDTWAGRVAAYCERDANGYYHAVAAIETEGSLRNARLSSSTYAGMAARLAQQLV